MVKTDVEFGKVGSGLGRDFFAPRPGRAELAQIHRTMHMPGTINSWHQFLALSSSSNNIHLPCLQCLKGTLRGGFPKVRITYRFDLFSPSLLFYIK